MPALPAAGRLARAGRARAPRGIRRRRATGAGRCRASATRARGSCCSAWRRRRTARTAPGGCSPATARATSSTRRSGARALPASPSPSDRETGCELHGVRITAAVRCAPPANRPDAAGARRMPALERARSCSCSSDVRVVVCLGAFAWDAALRLRRALTARTRSPPRPRPRFGHGAEAAGRAVAAARLLPPEPAEHVHRQADRRRCSTTCLARAREIAGGAGGGGAGRVAFRRVPIDERRAARQILDVLGGGGGTAERRARPARRGAMSCSTNAPPSSWRTSSSARCSTPTAACGAPTASSRRATGCRRATSPRARGGAGSRPARACSRTSWSRGAEADDELGTLQDTMLPVEVGDRELRDGHRRDALAHRRRARRGAAR